ncbi:DUF397 domain-containing protein [Actinomadura sp. DSM 109109]|nr:DUF397 domain-containing protein [Actinomadura lepetitiana]
MITWRKSSHTGGGNDEACVELAELNGRVWVRDSRDPDGGRLEIGREVFTKLLTRAKRSELDLRR